MEVRYAMHYADGTSYYSTNYATSNQNWEVLATDDISVHAGMRGTVTSIQAQVRKTSNYNYGSVGRVEVSGFETAP